MRQLAVLSTEFPFQCLDADLIHGGNLFANDFIVVALEALQEPLPQPNPLYICCGIITIHCYRPAREIRYAAICHLMQS
jgi:hypothetical protein